MWWIVGSALWVAGGFVALSTHDPQPAYHDLQKPNQANQLDNLKEPNKPNYGTMIVSSAFTVTF